MESKDLNSSVQDEQFGEPTPGTENTEDNQKENLTNEQADEQVNADVNEDAPELVAKTEEAHEHEMLEQQMEATSKVANELTMDELDMNKLEKQEILDHLGKLLDVEDVAEVKDFVERLKIAFYKKHKVELEKVQKEFVEKGGEEEAFTFDDGGLEEQLKAYLKLFKEKKSASNKNVEEEKQANLDEKNRIIVEIEHLINGKESLNKTFHEFRELQNRWREIGVVPQNKVKELWNSYNYQVEKFYDYIKINKELRDLDLKKNLENKISLCEKAEELLLEPSIVNAFKELQKQHDRWREIGPVPADMKTQIWERFKAATTKINKKHHEYFDNLKKEQKKNLEAKTHICEKAEVILEAEISSHGDWKKHSDEIIELQKIWKTIGFAPKKDNNKIYERFRSTCDKFFDKKREFYSKNKDMQDNNLQMKMDLCVQAESLKDSTDWKKTTEQLIKLQARWKQVGPVPRKDSDVIWKRFRAACDHFFNRKSGYFSNIDKTYDDNLRMKEELIEEVKNFNPSEDVDENFKILKEFQRKWADIGFVPYKEKDRIQNVFREEINKHFDELKVDEYNKTVLKYKNKLEHILSKPNADFKLRQERDRSLNKLKQLESDITLWENNIGFFADSKNASSMITEVKSKIEKAKEKIRILESKIQMIDDLDND